MAARVTLELELAMESHPHQVLEVGVVPDTPAVGDYVRREDSGWYGYVSRRRWDVDKHGNVVVRCWLRPHP